VSGSSNRSFVPDARSVPHNSWNTRFTDHFPTRLLYARHLWPTLWLVIFRQGLRSPLGIALCLIAQYNSGITHVAYVYLALPYESDAGSCTGRGRQSGCGSRPFVYSENNADSKFTFVTRYEACFLRSR